MSWKKTGTLFACAALALAAPGGAAQDSINGQGDGQWREHTVGFVVRHGPDLLQLSAGLLQGLLNGEATRATLAESAGGNNFKLSVVDLGDQPPGVYAGTLVVASGATRCEPLAKACLDLLQRELDTRLHKTLAAELRHELEAVRAERAQVEGSAGKVEQRATRLSERDPASLRERRAAEEQRQREIEVHVATEAAALDRLSKDLAVARERHDAATAQRLALGERVEQLEMETDVVQTASGKQAAMELRRRLIQERTKLEALEAELSRSGDLVSKVSDELQSATMQLSKLHTERDTLAKHVEVARAQMDELRALEVEQASLARERGRLDAAVEALLEQERSLEKRLRALRPVRVERW